MMSDSLRARIAGASLLMAGMAVGAVGCGSDQPQASGTKTDWLRSCDSIADCGQDWGWSCLCGICTTTCSGDSDCEAGVCGSVIATAAACGSDDGFSAQGEQICLPESGGECLEAELATGTTLGDAELVSCGAPGALICEDFEGPLPAAYSTWGEGEYSAGLQECQAHQGVGALRLTGVDDAYSQTRMRLPQPLESGALHARFYVRVEAGGTFPQQLILFEFWDQEEGQVDDRTTIYLNLEEKVEVYLGNTETTLKADASAPLTRDQWHCVELGLELSDTAGAVVVNVDGSPVIEVSDVDTLPSDPVSVAVLESLPAPESQGTSTVFLMDDLVITTGPIGCD